MQLAKCLDSFKSKVQVRQVVLVYSRTIHHGFVNLHTHMVRSAKFLCNLPIYCFLRKLQVALSSCTLCKCACSAVGVVEVVEIHHALKCIKRRTWFFSHCVQLEVFNWYFRKLVACESLV